MYNSKAIWTDTQTAGAQKAQSLKMNFEHLELVSRETKIGAGQVQAVAQLLSAGATVPFIARYRKEATGSLDEVAITTIRDRLDLLDALDKRREAILHSIEERGLLTEELKQKILAAQTLSVLEDIYLPYRPKRRTRATMAKEKGLEPLAALIFEQRNIHCEAEAQKFVNPEKGVESIEDALAGARDIIAEWINENEFVRTKIRRLFEAKSMFQSRVIKGKEEEGIKYKDYFDWEEPSSSAPPHRILAMRRGENEGILTLRLAPPEEEATALVKSIVVKNQGAAADQVQIAAGDCYKRLLAPSIENELRGATKKRADEESIRVFAENLRQLLLAPPLGQKTVLAIDPGFRTGCKVVCLDRNGKLLHTDTIFLLSPEGASAATEKIPALCKRFQIEAIAIGNGTASRETETWIRKLSLPAEMTVVMVNESGASVYSASDVAREEFPEQDVTVRGAVSIGRRLIDPLAELVKIDPKSIGVGQYQHDVDQTTLKRGLDDVVGSCVNAVGVEVNTASKQLLTYVSGLGPQLAANIVRYREENGAFRSRSELRKVPKLGPRAFEQSAGFLRIRDGANPLDASAVHPESYSIVASMAKDLNCKVKDLMLSEPLRKSINPEKYVTSTVGLPTLSDILSELAKPGRDPRKHFETFRFTEGVEKIEDVKPGMKLPGIVTNVTAFGAFIDIGVHQDGLVHISQLADRFVKDPNEVVKVHQKVNVTVLDVDIPRKRISLSMRNG